MIPRGAAALAAMALALGGCSSGGYVLPTSGGHTAGTTNGGGSTTTAGDSTGGTTSAGSSTGGTTGNGSSTSSGGTTSAPPTNACDPAAAASLPLGGSCDNGGVPGTCVGEAFYCLIDGDAGLCPTTGYVSGYPFAAVLDGGADGGPLGTSELFDLDAGQPLFNGLCAPSPGSLPPGSPCTTDSSNWPFGDQPSGVAWRAFK